MPYTEPSAEQLQRLVTDTGDESPIVMLNLLRYRDSAFYPPGSDAEPCSGREAYQRYAAKVTPMLAEAGGKILWLGNAKRTVIGPEDEEWDDVILVQYPSRKAFLGMVTRAEYQSIAVHRTAALADSRLVPMVGAGDLALSAERA